MRGVVAAGSKQTAQAGAQILEAGGNAVDAAVAATFASFIAEASISAIGGGGFALLQQPGQAPHLYDFFCAMPGKNIRPDAYERMDFTAVPIDFGGRIDTYSVGRGSTAVPGNPAGLAQLLIDAGSLPLADVLAPAIELAREGVVISTGQEHVMRSIDSVLVYDESSAALFAPEDNPLQAGDTFTNTAFANTLTHLIQTGLHDFYNGELAQAILDDHRQNGGLLTQDDLHSYQVIQRQPVQVSYRGHTLYTNPPPSVGGSLYALGLKLLENVDFSTLAFHKADHLVILGEVIQQTSLARRRDNPYRFEQHDQLHSWLTTERVQHDWQELYERLQRHLNQSVQLEKPDYQEPDGHGSTTHISVVDENGLAISITTTPGATAGYTIADTGMKMNNNLGEWDLNPEGFHRSAAGTRLSSMMSPSLVNTADGRQIVLGSAGSNRIRSALIQVTSNILDWQLPLATAVNAPRVHYYQQTLELEGGIEAEAEASAALRGYKTTLWRSLNLYFGGTNVAMRDADGVLSGAGDVRRGAAAIVVA
jgi:gamma-glutamyltranspeptidase / glutathione hydrolase